MRRVLVPLAGLAALCALALWQLSAPKALPPDAFDGFTGHPKAGELVFHAAGCASCHMAPQSDSPELAGGMRFASPFGTFRAPNISAHPVHGIGRWTVRDLGNAMIYGTSPAGQHYYPAFPYSSYGRMALWEGGLQDIADLHSYLMTLPASDSPSEPHDLAFPFTLRRGLGLWKQLFAQQAWVTPLDTENAHTLARGRYLVEALGHCGACHTPRNLLGGLQNSAWLSGAANPTGRGRIPPIDALEWGERDLTYYLKTGFTPDFDSAGGHMAAVIASLSKLPESECAAIAAYLLDLAARPR